MTYRRGQQAGLRGQAEHAHGQERLAVGGAASLAAGGEVKVGHRQVRAADADGHRLCELKRRLINLLGG